MTNKATDSTGGNARSGSANANKKNQKKGKPGFSAPRSEGIGIEELRGYVFSYGGVPGQQTKYAKAKKAIADYIGMTSDCGQDLYTTIMEGEEPEFEEPEDPGKAATKGQFQRYDIPGKGGEIQHRESQVV
jgi:hypothetical protein